MNQEFYVIHSKDNLFFGYEFTKETQFVTRDILDAYWFKTEYDANNGLQNIEIDIGDVNIIELSSITVNDKIKKLMSMKEHLYHLIGIVDISYSDLFYVHHNLDKNFYRYIVFTLDKIEYEFIKPYYLRMKTENRDNFAIFIKDIQIIVTLKLITNFKYDHIYDRVNECWICKCR